MNNGIIYQSFSYKMIKELKDNKQTPAWIRLWLYFSILDSKGKTIYMLNSYISQKLDIPISTIKYSISKLSKEGLIVIDNARSWRRQIRLTHKPIINDTDLPELKKQNDSLFHEAKGRKKITDYIFITEEEEKILKEIIGEEDLKFYITGLNNFIKSSKKKYDSHFKMITTWHKKNEDQKKAKKKKYDVPLEEWFLDTERENDTTELFDYNWLDEEEDF